MPEGEIPVPAVLIIAGSGPVDRDGNLPGMPNDSLKLLAQGLAGNGIATLRIDKRGIGASREGAPKEEELRFGTYVDDAVAWLSILRVQPRITSVSLVGHSEGALVATLAASKTKVAALVLIAGASVPAARAIGRQLEAAGTPAELKDASRRIAAALEAGRRVADVPGELEPLYRPSVQNYLMSWLPLDPAAELARSSNPVLIVQGTTDLQVGTDDARRLVAARPDAEVMLIDGMNMS